MDGKKERVCLACGELHEGERCPLVQKKLNRYHKFPQKNFLMGNIFLTCIKKKMDFFQILLEIEELSEETHDSFKVWDAANMPIEAAIEYFSISLNCNARDFVKAPEKTIEEYSCPAAH
jgi:hypothetical protein